MSAAFFSEKNTTNKQLFSQLPYSSTLPEEKNEGNFTALFFLDKEDFFPTP